MRHLKHYKLFESVKPFDESIFQELIDEGASYNFISLTNGHFCIEITDCEDESMINKAVKKLNLDIELNAECRYSKVEKNYYIFDMCAINKFKCLIEDLKMNRYYSDLIFKKGTVVFIHQNLEDKCLWVKTDQILYFESYLRTQQITGNYEAGFRIEQGLMSNLVEEVFGFRPISPYPTDFKTFN